MSNLPELPEQAQEHVRVAKRVAEQAIQHARIHLERAARVRDRKRCLENAKECARIATGVLFDVYAAQYWRATGVHPEKFSPLLPTICEEVKRVISCQDLERVVCETTATKSVEWAERTARERENISIQFQSGEDLHKIVAEFRSHYARDPADRTNLLEKLARDIVNLHLGRVVAHVTDPSEYGEFRDKVFFAKAFIGERIASFLKADDYAMAWDLIGAECERMMATAACRARGETPLPNSDKMDRRAAVDSFLSSCEQETQLKVRKKYIWLAAGHKTARQFQYWQAGNNRATRQDDQNFRRILAMNPSDFLSLLKNKRII